MAKLLLISLNTHALAGDGSLVVFLVAIMCQPYTIIGRSLKNYIDSCYKVITFMETYRNILNPTHDKDSWPKSDQGPIIPPQAVNKRKGRKTMLKRRELGETSGFNNGKVSKKGLKMTCGVCGAVGHNKRFNGV